MINKYFIYFATMVLSAVLQQTWSQSQQHVWYFGNQKIDFTQPTLHIENIPSMGNITPQFLSDGAHDEYGRMVMNIVDDKVYNKFGGLIDYLESDLYSTPENVIIPYPASTCKYIILSTYNYSGASTITNSNVVDLAANNYLGSMSTSWSESSSGTLYRDIVVGKLNSNNERNFYLIDVTNSQSAGSNVKLRKYKISNSGVISLESTNWISGLILNNTSPNPNFSWYLTDVELSNDGQKIHFVNGSNKIYTIDLSTNTFSNYTTTKNALTSIELTPNGRIFFSYNQGIGYTNLINEGFLLPTPESANSRLELLFDNSKILAINNSGQCNMVSDINNSLPGNPSLLFVGDQNSTVYIGIDGQTGLAHIPKQIDGEDYVAKYANGSSAGCCTFDEGINVTNVTFNSGGPWNQLNDYLISGTVEIASGTFNIVDSEIHFGPNGKIIIHPGAKLVVQNSTLTSGNCGDFWKGIELQGNAGAPQNFFSQGQLIIDQSVIENALQGVSVYGTLGSQIDWSKTGGIIKSTNSTFKNNWKDVAFLSYTLPNDSRFTETEFITTQTLKNGVDPGWHVTMYDVNGVIFEGCEFRNTVPQASNFHKGSGIKSIDSKFSLTGLCVSSPCQNIIHSSINNLDFGVDATGSNLNQAVDVSFVNFTNIIRGIQLTGTRNSRVIENNIQLNNSLNLNDEVVGIHLISCEKHEVENNMIDSQNGIVTSWGIIIDNSNLGGISKATNLVYRNELHNLTYGITTFNENAALATNNGASTVVPGTGLVFKCNRFYNGDISDITALGAVAINQGICNSLLHDPSNNVFSENPTSQADIWYMPNNYNMRYFYDYSSNPAFRTEPMSNLYNAANTDLFACDNIFKYSESCPSNNYELLTTTLINLKDNYITEIEHYTDSIDGGDQSFLLQAIDVEDPTVVYALLTPLQGRLSDEVLISLINEVPRIPYGVANDILVQNSPLSEKVKLELETSTFPSYYKVQLLSVSGLSPFDQLISELAFYKHEVSLMDNELYNRIIQDTTIINKLDTITNVILNDLSEEEKLRFLLEFNIANQEQNNADSLFYVYTNNYSNYVYSVFQELMIEKMNQPGKLLAALSDTNVNNQLVNLIVSNPASREAKIASKLFEFLISQEVYSDIDEINYIKSMNIISENMRPKIDLSLEVFPNPTTDIISLNLGLVDNDEALIEIVSLEGKLVFKDTFKANNTFVDVKDLDNGNYIIKVTYKNGIKSKAQFTKL
jgi:Secretion system C-terminal sorting domain